MKSGGLREEHRCNKFFSSYRLALSGINLPRFCAILHDDNKPSAMELWKPFFDGISDFFETKKKDFIKIMGIMNGENDYPSDMVVKPPFATGKLPQNGIRGSSSIQV